MLSLGRSAFFALRASLPLALLAITATCSSGDDVAGSPIDASADADHDATLPPVDSGAPRDAFIPLDAFTADALAESDSSTSPPDATIVDASFPDAPSRGKPVSYGAAIVTDTTTATSGFIQTITPGAGTASMSVISYDGFSAAPGDCVTISGSDTPYDSGHGGKCTAGFEVVSAVAGNPSSLVFATSITAAYSAAISNDSIPVIFETKSGLVLSVYRHGSTDVRDPGVLVLRTSKNAGASFEPYAGMSHVRKADGSWATTSAGGRCGAGIVDDMAGCLFADGSGACENGASNRELRNVAGGVAPNGNIVLSWATACWNPHVWGGIFYAYSETDGATWSEPKELATLPAGQSAFGWCGTYGGVLDLPTGLAIGVTGYPGDQSLCQVPGFGYLVLSHDDGKTWGVNASTDFIRVSDANHEQLPTNENTYAYLGNDKIIGFGRDICNGTTCPLLLHSSGDLGKTWSITPTSFAPSPPVAGQTLLTDKLVSPWLFDAHLPGGDLTLLFAERQQDTNITTVAALRAISFNPASAIANPQGLGPTQTLWTSTYNDWGYPSIARTSPTTILIQWDSEQFPAGPLNLFTMSAQFGCAPGQPCQL